MNIEDQIIGLFFFSTTAVEACHEYLHPGEKDDYL